MAGRAKPLPKRSTAEVREAYPALRQSRLADFDSCALMTRFGLEGYDFTNGPQARGIIFHRFAAEVLRTLRRTGETSIPVEEALVVLYEVAAQRDMPDEDVVVPPAAERRLLRIAAIKFAHENTFRMDRLIDVERRLEATVPIMDLDSGEMVPRTITGQPDALIADPPDGAIIPDWKTTLSAPAEYTGEQRDTPAGLSYMGYFQQRVYALLGFANYPSLQRISLREFYVLDGVARVATVHREQMEHIERELAVQAELFDRALAGGSKSKLWQPTPGKHCSYCPKPQRCPIEPEVRIAEGGITTVAEGKRIAAEFVVADRARMKLREGLKGIVEVHGPMPVKSGKERCEVGWETLKGGGRRFGVHVPAESTRGPKDASLEDAFREAAKKKEAA